VLPRSGTVEDATLADPATRGHDAAVARWMMTWGAALGGVGVAAGAFGAHLLKARLDAPMLAAFETGARYHLVHAVALLATGLVAERHPGRLARWAGAALLGGTVVFSGSLYALALTGIRGLGAVTPLGGTALMLGWALLAAHAARVKGPGGGP
jgi:uncharacterized membrane protein YgdD (TMEM256/DUF423 family)